MWATVVAVLLFALLIKSVVSNMDLHKENTALRAKLGQQQMLIFTMTYNNDSRKNILGLKIFDPSKEPDS